MRSSGSVAAIGALGVAAMLGFGACSSSGGTGAVPDTSGPGASTPGANADSGRVLLALPDSRPGDVIALRAGDDGSTIEWIDRRAGTIRAVDVSAATGDSSSLTADDIETLATIAVGIEGEQRGLLGHTVIDGVRYAAWTDPDTFDLIVGEVGPDGVERVVWDGGGTAGGAVGGHLEAGDDGQLILGIGQLTDWARTNGSGALVQLDPDGPADQEPVIVSDGYVNPFAFAVGAGNSGDELWVADNAVGDDVERIGRGDLADRDELTATGRDPRARPHSSSSPAAPPTRSGSVSAASSTPNSSPGRPAPRPAASGYGASLGPCLTGAAVLADGTIVTATADGLVRPDAPEFIRNRSRNAGLCPGSGTVRQHERRSGGRASDVSRPIAHYRA